MPRNFRWKQGKSPREAWDAARYETALDRRIEAALNKTTPRLEADAKQDAPWTDRTGNARQTLAAFAVKVEGPIQATGITYEGQVNETYAPFGRGKGWAVILRQWMSYGRSLETIRQGRYAIVLPTLEQHQRVVWAKVKRQGGLR
jgi:hypothetical protein